MEPLAFSHKSLNHCHQLWLDECQHGKSHNLRTVKSLQLRQTLVPHYLSTQDCFTLKATKWAAYYKYPYIYSTEELANNLLEVCEHTIKNSEIPSLGWTTRKDLSAWPPGGGWGCYLYGVSFLLQTTGHWQPYGRMPVPPPLHRDLGTCVTWHQQ